MKLKEFNYAKPNQQAEPRKVLVFKEDSKYLEGIDLNKFSPQEQQELLGHVKDFEDKIKDFVAKGWRRFKTENVSK